MSVAVPDRLAEGGDFLADGLEDFAGLARAQGAAIFQLLADFRVLAGQLLQEAHQLGLGVLLEVGAQARACFPGVRRAGFRLYLVVLVFLFLLVLFVVFILFVLFVLFVVFVVFFVVLLDLEFFELLQFIDLFSEVFQLFQPGIVCFDFFHGLALLEAFQVVQDHGHGVLAGVPPVGTGTLGLQFFAGLDGHPGGVPGRAVDPGQQGSVRGAGQIPDRAPALVRAAPGDDLSAGPLVQIVPGEAGKGVGLLLLFGGFLLCSHERFLC